MQGDVELRNLHLKPEALADLDLPITVKAGLLGKLTLKVHMHAGLAAHVHRPIMRLCALSSMLHWQEAHATLQTARVARHDVITSTAVPLAAPCTVLMSTCRAHIQVKALANSCMYPCRYHGHVWGRSLWLLSLTGSTFWQVHAARQRPKLARCFQHALALSMDGHHAAAYRQLGRSHPMWIVAFRPCGCLHSLL